MTKPLAALVLLISLAGCGEEVHVRLLRGECEDPSLSDIFSVKAKLRRADGVGVERCVTISTALTSLTEMEGLLAAHVVFDDIPTGGGWTLWVEGFSGASCSTGGLACGKSAGLTLPPASGQIDVFMDCAPLFSTGKFTKIKQCLAE